MNNDDDDDDGVNHQVAGKSQVSGEFWKSDLSLHPALYSWLCPETRSPLTAETERSS